MHALRLTLRALQVSGSAEMAKTEQSSIKQVKQRSVSWSMVQDLWAPTIFMFVNLAALGFGGWRLHRDGLTHTNLALIIGAPPHPGLEHDAMPCRRPRSSHSSHLAVLGVIGRRLYCIGLTHTILARAIHILTHMIGPTPLQRLSSLNASRMSLHDSPHCMSMYPT